MLNSDNGIVSKTFVERNIFDFYSACKFVAKLPYKRNSDKNNITCIFDDNGGTCSTKHAVLRKLALENHHDEVKLILGIFKMDSNYTSAIKNTLEEHDLDYIPEAHNYLKIEKDYFDFTKSDSDYQQFKDKILQESEMEYHQIAAEKINLHKSFLENWLISENLKYNLDKIWQIREKCIKDLQNIQEEILSNSSPVCYQNSPEIRNEYKQ